MSDKMKDLIEYIGSFLALLFLSLRDQFGINIVDSWVETVTTLFAVIVVSWGIYHNKHLFVDKPSAEK